MPGMAFEEINMKEDLDYNTSKPRIILVLQFYDPEPVYKGQRFAEAILKAGYDVEVVTGFPNYPGGKVYEGYRIRWIQRSIEIGVLITRLPLYPSHVSVRIKRVFNYVTFMVSVFVYLTFFAQRSNLIYGYHPPLTVGLAITASQIFRQTPTVIDIHDLWPDSLSVTGMISNQRALKFVNVACNWMYKRSTHIILHSHGFHKRLVERGVPSTKLTTVIGWANEYPSPKPTLTVSKNLGSKNILKVLYAGNVGPAQGLDTVLEAAQALQSCGKTEMATFFILGSGLSLNFLKAKSKSLGLNNVVFLPRVTPVEAEAYMVSADVLLLHLRDSQLFSLNIPSKLQTYMLAGKPIILGASGEAEKLLLEAEAGISVPPGDAKKMAEAVLRLAEMPTPMRKKFGENASTYYWRELCMEKGIKHFASIFDSIRCD